MSGALVRVLCSKALTQNLNTMIRLYSAKNIDTVKGCISMKIKNGTGDASENGKNVNNIANNVKTTTKNVNKRNQNAITNYTSNASLATNIKLQSVAHAAKVKYSDTIAQIKANGISVKLNKLNNTVNAIPQKIRTPIPPQKRWANNPANISATAAAVAAATKCSSSGIVYITNAANAAAKQRVANVIAAANSVNAAGKESLSVAPAANLKLGIFSATATAAAKSSKQRPAVVTAAAVRTNVINTLTAQAKKPLSGSPLKGKPALNISSVKINPALCSIPKGNITVSVLAKPARKRDSHAASLAPKLNAVAACGAIAKETVPVAVRQAKQESATKNVEYYSRDMLNKLVREKNVVVFMKGNPETPRCGFSNAVVQILRMHGVKKYNSHDVLKNEKLKEALKEFSDWPTIPQVFINGEFIGGCDILLQLHQNGELIKKLHNVGIQSQLVKAAQSAEKAKKFTKPSKD